MERKKTKEIRIGKIKIGGNNPVAVQSMANADMKDAVGMIKQIENLKSAGCEIVRVAVPDFESVKTIYKIKENIDIPLVADIHFDYKIAIECIHAGIDKIRINPGNIGSDDRVKAVVDECRVHNIPIRIGVNGGSLEKNILAAYDGKIVPQALCDSAEYHIRLLEKYDFDDIAVSLKSSDVTTMIESYRLISEKFNYPLHLGVTEAGTRNMGIIKSAIGIGALLSDGIGDTIRVSLTEDPVLEVKAGFDILRALGLYKKGINIISCPTCSRTKVDIIGIANEVEQRCRGIDKNMTVAVMGCAVNGPGEAKQADIGIAGGVHEGLLFKKGKIIRKIPEKDLVDEFIKEIEKF